MSFFRSIQFRLLLFFSLVAIIPIALVSIINLNTASELVEQEVQARQFETTEIIHDQVSLFIENIVHRLETMGRGSLSLQLERQEINNYIASYLEGESNIFRSAWLINAEGDEIGGIVAGRPIAFGDLANRREDEIFFRPQRGENYFSNVRLINGLPQISISVPIFDNLGNFAGVAGAVIELSEAWTTIEELELGANGYAMLLDRRGNIIVHRDASILNAGFNLGDAPPYAAALRASNLTVYQYQSPIAGEVIGSALPIEGPEWVLLVERPESEAYAAISQARSNIFLGLSVALIFAVGISFFLTRQLASPIISLRDIVQRFGAGNLSVRSSLKSGDEYQQLSEGFNTMAERLQNRIDEIDQKNKALQEANEKVLETARLKDEFLAVMSHELRTPLNAIIGFSGILLMDETLPEKQAFQVQRIETNSERLLNLINDILDISRIQAGRMSLNPTPLNIRKELNRIHEQLGILAKNKNLEFSHSVADDVPSLITVDEDALIKILTNLCSNAIKFTSYGSVVIEVSREERNLLIQVRDTGIGIPPHMYEIIFEEFRQVDGSSMRQYGGTGLGLAIVRRLSMAMGGSVTVKSRVNEGSNFTVTLPLLAESETNPVVDTEKAL